MSILVKLRKKDNKFRIWTTVSDGWLTDWVTKEEAIKYLQFRVKRDAKWKCDEIAAEFPHSWYGTDGKFITDEEGRERYQKVLESRVKKFR